MGGGASRGGRQGSGVWRKEERGIPVDILVVIELRNSSLSLSTCVSMLADNFSMSTTPSATSLSNVA